MSASSMYTGFVLAVLSADVGHATTEPATRLSVRAVGDFDADGRTDIVMSADPNDIIQIHRGLPDGTFEHDASVQLRPEPCYWTDKFGHSVAVGDFDGDGFDDLAVGAPNADETRGRVYLHRGGPGGVHREPASELTASDLPTGAWFGIVLGAGDVNGDGRDDLIALASHLLVEGELPSRLYWYDGDSSGLQLIREQTIIADAFEMPTLLDRFVACDVNGDGFDDVVIQAGHQFSAEQARLYPLWGGPAGLEVSWDAGEPHPEGGWTWSGGGMVCGDLNSDGLGDVLAANVDESAMWFLPGGARTSFGAGATRLYGGDSEWASGTGPEPYYWLEILYGSDATTGDLDGDGVDDLLVGQRANSSFGQDAGVAWLHRGSPSGPEVLARTRIEPCDPQQPDGDFGTAVQALGDIDGDGFEDAMVSGDTVPAILRGRAVWPAEVCADYIPLEMPTIACDDEPPEDTGTGDTGRTDTATPEDDDDPPPPEDDNTARCGCATGGAPIPLGALVLLGFLARRR